MVIDICCIIADIWKSFTPFSVKPTVKLTIKTILDFGLLQILACKNEVLVLSLPVRLLQLKYIYNFLYIVVYIIKIRRLFLRQPKA